MMDEGTYGRGFPIISTDEDSGDKINLLDAEEEAADWEYGPRGSRLKAVRGSHEPCRMQ